MKCTRPQGITTFPFGHVETPISVNSNEAANYNNVTTDSWDLWADLFN